MVDVNWDNLLRAKNLWSLREGFHYVETPYWVSRDAIQMTFPPEVEKNKNRYQVMGTDYHLVASGEQSFCQMMLDGTLQPGRYSTITPCFRDDAVDALHQHHFMKLEVIDLDPIDHYALDEMIDAAQTIFFELTVGRITLAETHEGYDLELNGVEIGSYGFREANGFRWAYGTGYADPRFSIAEAAG